jgi:hypothetical protein
LLERVPKCFLVLAGCFALLQTIGILLLFEKKRDSDEANLITVNGVVPEDEDEERTKSTESSSISNNIILPSSTTERNSLGV